MLFSNITVLDEKLEVRENRYVGVRGDRIAYVGGAPPKDDFGEARDGRGKLLMPGFYNAHAHSPMTLARGYAENLSLRDWLNARIFPFEDELDGEAAYWGSLLAMAESFRFGVVSTSDMYFFAGDMVRAVIESGAKANIARAVVAFSDDEDIAHNKGFQEAKALFDEYDGAEGGRIKIEMALHAEYSSTGGIARQLAEYAKKSGAGVQVHLSETEAEHEECKGRRGGLTPAEYLNEAGFFDVRATAAHCVWLSAGDMDILAEKNVTAASCPVSNMKLASGVCDVPALLRKGINVAIGTDGAASNNSLNFFEEMKFFALANKVRYGDPTLVTPAETVAAATFAGAKAQGRTDSGSISVGNKADLIVIDLCAPNMRPAHNLVNNIVYSASGGDVLLTMADGRILFENGEYTTIDIEKTIFNVERSVNRILGKIPPRPSDAKAER